ncbi:TOMM precursor leader peptide-binding protein [Marinilabilia salmonicolor]|uniref:Bacteriocin biosynthesis cyclodehydratase domain-containing protein n=1 Tax=Marinilabilia salmonicolor TaxID=989 RepID=A0A368UIU3_9BACT|nr:TOMM precursor leader peptide-binding protein [Marinilabilia salmonicolor]RCW21181.1 bacteriocin biosynthesis cyclodehydratase domain-containing protein [Marinilabilia salmonicolor]
MSLLNKYDLFFDKENNVYQIRTKSDAITIEFTDQEKESIFNSIVKLYERKEFLTFQQLQEKLITNFQKDKIIDVIQELRECSILTEENFEEAPEAKKTDSPFSLYLPLGENKSLFDIKIGFFGEPILGKKINEKATDYGYHEFNILDIHKKATEKEVYSLFQLNDFIIVDSSSWNPHMMEFINEIALEENKPWILYDGKIDLANISIGPIFHGRETGCYDCYRSRIRSNDEFSSYTDAYENYLKDRKANSKIEAIPNVIKDIIASIIIMDVSKYLGGWYPPETWRSCLIFNIHNYQISKHHFLKAPICNKCKPSLDYNPSPWLESLTLKT